MVEFLCCISWSSLHKLNLLVRSLPAYVISYFTFAQLIYTFFQVPNYGSVVLPHLLKTVGVLSLTS